ncbi:MAG TPA: hypothetical protein VF212_16200 [Longimicrobiales bacterium]
MTVGPRHERRVRRAGTVLLAALLLLLTTACLTRRDSLRPGPYAEPVTPGGAAVR